MAEVNRGVPQGSDAMAEAPAKTIETGDAGAEHGCKGRRGNKGGTPWPQDLCVECGDARGKGGRSAWQCHFMGAQQECAQQQKAQGQHDTKGIPQVELAQSGAQARSKSGLPVPLEDAHTNGEGDHGDMRCGVEPQALGGSKQVVQKGSGDDSHPAHHKRTGEGGQDEVGP